MDDKMNKHMRALEDPMSLFGMDRHDNKNDKDMVDDGMKNYKNDICRQAVDELFS